MNVKLFYLISFTFVMLMLLLYINQSYHENKRHSVILLDIQGKIINDDRDMELLERV